jgi:hypothetical protein
VLLQQALRVPERRFKMESMFGLQAVLHAGTDEQREAASDALDQLAAGEDGMVAKMATMVRSQSLEDAGLDVLVDE